MGVTGRGRLQSERPLPVAPIKKTHAQVEKVISGRLKNGPATCPVNREFGSVRPYLFLQKILVMSFYDLFNPYT